MRRTDRVRVRATRGQLRGATSALGKLTRLSGATSALARARTRSSQAYAAEKLAVFEVQLLHSGGRPRFPELPFWIRRARAEARSRYARPPSRCNFCTRGSGATRRCRTVLHSPEPAPVRGGPIVMGIHGVSRGATSALGRDDGDPAVPTHWLRAHARPAWVCAASRTARSAPYGHRLIRGRAVRG